MNDEPIKILKKAVIFGDLPYKEDEIPEVIIRKWGEHIFLLHPNYAPIIITRRKDEYEICSVRLRDS